MSKDAGCRPKVSIGIPVRNGERFLRAALESIACQDYDDYEAIISDNASTDKTEAIAREFTARDRHFCYHRNDADLGQIGNFNRVFGLSRGEYFRWLGVDDRLEPSYLRKCVASLDAHTEAVGVTTLWRLVDDDNTVHFREYTGRRVDSPYVWRRLSRALWFMRADRLFFDPIYSMLRSSSLHRTNLLPIDPWTDRHLAIELCLLGPFCHVHECLVTRRRAGEGPEILLPRYHSSFTRDMTYSRTDMYLGFASLVRKQSFGPGLKLCCQATIVCHFVFESLFRFMRRGLGFLRRRLVRLINPPNDGSASIPSEASPAARDSNPSRNVTNR
ncbi:MAG: glycosyltransferase family 2 protein [Planctomycetes bacterium]|nr:glycosyltransferase family 2 protein [Planctomycetota bacterium]